MRTGRVGKSCAMALCVNNAIEAINKASVDFMAGSFTDREQGGDERVGVGSRFKNDGNACRGFSWNDQLPIKASEWDPVRVQALRLLLQVRAAEADGGNTGNGRMQAARQALQRALGREQGQGRAQGEMERCLTVFRLGLNAGVMLVSGLETGQVIN